MNINFELPDDVWWRSTYCGYNNRELLNQIQIMSEQIRFYKSQDEYKDIFDDFNTTYRLLYVLECLNAERSVDINLNCDHISMVLDNIEEMVKSDRKSLTKNDLKIKNLYDTVKEIFPDVVLPSFNPDELTVDFAKYLNRKIGDGLIENAGEYRTHEVKPAGEAHRYLDSNEIGDYMNDLFEMTRELLKENQGNTEILIKIGAKFMNQFLQIHPFSNGNGRVARILLSCLLSSISPILVSLHGKSNTTDRDVYLTCLSESRLTIESTPQALATYILECVHESIRKFFNYTSLTY